MQFINDRREMRGQSGFTLIELLVVIAILGILAGVVVFAVGGVTNNSQESACKLELRTAKTAVQAYRAAKAAWPDNPSQLGNGLFLETDTTDTVAGTDFVLELVTIELNPLSGTPAAATAPTYAWTGTGGGAEVDCQAITGITL